MALVLFFASVALLPSSHLRDSNPWAGRSGEAEALADIAAGNPIKLYLRGTAGERGVDDTPGLRNCSPDRGEVPINSLSKLIGLGEDYSESIIYTAEQMHRMHSAVSFAKAYNLTMFKKRRQAVLEICPSATPDPR